MIANWAFSRPIGADGDGLTRVPAITGTMASRLGVQAHIDFAEGYRGLAKLEMGFNADDGTQGQAGRLFGRQVYVGVQTPYGRVTIGRQYSVFLFAAGSSDLMGPNIYALSSLDAYLPNARYDNSLSWSHRLANGLSAGVSYSFGRDTTGGVPASGSCSGEESQVGESSACNAWSAMLKYDAGAYGLAAAIDTQNGGSGAQGFFFNGQPPVAMGDSSDTDRRISLGGYVNVGNGKVGAGWLGREFDTTATNIQSDAYYVTANYKVTPKVTVDGGVYSIANDDQNADATLGVIWAPDWIPTPRLATSAIATTPPTRCLVQAPTRRQPLGRANRATWWGCVTSSDRIEVKMKAKG